MNKLITIKGSELRRTKDGEKEYLWVTDQDDDNYSCWDAALHNSLMKNATVEIEFTKKGNFRNISAVEAKTGEDLPTQRHESVDLRTKSACYSYVKDVNIALIQAGQLTRKDITIK